MNHDGVNNLGRGSPKKHFRQIILKSVHLFLTKKIFKVFYTDLQGIPQAAMFFFTNNDGLNNLGRGSPKEHIYHIIFKSVQ